MNGRSLYFAYGSNMAAERLRARVPSARLMGSAVLAGHALRFHKPGSNDGSAKCDAALRGARALQLPGAYIATIEAVAADIDASEERRARELAIYA